MTGNLIPISAHLQLRKLAVTGPRGSIPRSVAIFILKRRKSRYRLCDEVSKIVPLDAPELKFHSIDSVVLDEVYWFGVQGYEGKVADVWHCLCEEASSTLEVGGNVGLFSVIGGRATKGTYRVVEPLPHLVHELRKNLDNNCLGRVAVLQGAAIPGQVETPVVLNIPNEGRAAPTGAQVLAGNDIKLRKSHKSIEATGYPFAKLAQGCDLIKIDAEGLETALLQSAFELLCAQKAQLMIEVLPDAQSLAELLARYAAATRHTIHIVPEYGSDELVRVSPEDFSSQLPSRYNSKDVFIGPERAFPKIF